jgi:putative ABC transport system permease protein
MPANFFGKSQRTLVVASRNLLRQPRRSMLALLIVCGGVVTFLLAGGFINWVLAGMREWTIHSHLGHIQIVRPGYFAKGLGDPYSYLLPKDSSIVNAHDPGNIRTLAPRLSFSGLLSKGEETVSFLGEGIDPLLEAPIAEKVFIREGKDLQRAPPDSVLLGVGFANSVGARPGDRVVLLATTAEGGINATELQVAGLFATSTKAYDDSSLRVPIDVARRLMRVEGATSWVVLLDKTENTSATVAELRARLPARDFEVVPWTELADFYNKTAKLFTRQVDVVRLLIALIVVLSITNTQSMTVIERTGEIGTSMALGTRRRGILGLFLLEGVLLGLVGAGLGVVIGLVLGEVISAIGIPMPPPPGMEMGFTGEISISRGLAIDAFVLAFVTTLLASVFPAWKASRMNIVDALRHQR